MHVTLEDAWAKLCWAQTHLQRLRSEVEAFEARDSHRIGVEVDVAAGQYVFRVEQLEAIPADWGLIAGDCLHNARTALDYLMVRLVSLVTGEDPREISTVQFPVYSHPERFMKKMQPLRERMPALSGFLNRLEELQPYNAQNSSVWGLNEHGWPRWPHTPVALDRLSTLDNRDKHRVIHAAWLGSDSWRKGAALQLPEGLRSTGAQYPFGPFEEGSAICIMQFEPPLPSEWVPDEAALRAAFPLRVSIPAPDMEFGLLETLEFCLDGTRAVLSLFDPVFRHNLPPLPVTATARFL